VKHAMSGRDPGFRRHQVRSAEREAWAGKVRDGRARYSFDGLLRFWRQRRRGESRIVAPWQTPALGWWHRLGCNCELCLRTVDPRPERGP
jgi:hypothetical protein